MYCFLLDLFDCKKQIKGIRYQRSKNTVINYCIFIYQFINSIMSLKFYITKFFCNFIPVKIYTGEDLYR